MDHAGCVTTPHNREGHPCRAVCRPGEASAELTGRHRPRGPETMGCKGRQHAPQPSRPVRPPHQPVDAPPAACPSPSHPFQTYVLPRLRYRVGNEEPPWQLIAMKAGVAFGHNSGSCRKRWGEVRGTGFEHKWCSPAPGVVPLWLCIMYGYRRPFPGSRGLPCARAAAGAAKRERERLLLQREEWWWRGDRNEEICLWPCLTPHAGRGCDGRMLAACRVREMRLFSSHVG